MLTLYFILRVALDDRLRRDETGDVVAWIGIAAMTLALIVFMIPGAKDVVSAALQVVKDKITGLA